QDGKIGTPDDFDVATFVGVLTEQSGSEPKPQVITSPVVFSGFSGAITGKITDPNGSAIANATITATRSPDSQSYATSSDENGRYAFASLSPGLYELRVSAVNFKPSVITDVLVRVSNILEINVVLDVGGVTETVTVSAGAQTLQTTTAELSVTRNSRQVVRLKKNINIITKAGGPQVSTPRLREYFPETLLWQPSLETDAQGHAQLKFKLADNITTWKLSVIASTEDGRIGTVEIGRAHV